MKRNTLSRFIDFTDVIFINNGVLLQGDYYYNGCILRFYNGLLSNDGKDRPAVECVDAHIEYWENGKLHNENNIPAIISDYGESVEYWENGRKDIKKNKEVSFYYGNIAEKEFAKYLNKNNIAFIHLDQIEDTYSHVLKNNEQKRPDYIIFNDNNINFIDVKARTILNHNYEKYFLIDKIDYKKLLNLQNIYEFEIIISFIDIKNIPDNEYKFISVSMINKHYEYIKSKNGYNDKLKYIVIPDKLLYDNYSIIKDKEYELLKLIEYDNEIFYSNIYDLIYNMEYNIEFSKYLENLGYYKK